MQFGSRCLMYLVASTLLVGAYAPRADAAEIAVDTSVGGGQVGGFYGPYMPSDEAPLSYPPIIPPDNDPLFQNYFMGRTTSTPVATGFTTPERRAFFFFDMAGVAASIPAGDVITDVTISLELLPGFTSVLANFATDDKEIVDFSSTSYSPAEILDPDTFSIPFDAIWSTFGSTAPYGGFEILGPGTGTPTVADTYVISLPGAISDLEAAIVGGDIFIVTAKLATYDPDPIGVDAPPALTPYEYVFGLTDVVSSVPTTAAPELIITTAPIPEPSTFLLAIVGMIGLSAFRRRKRR